MSYLAYQFETFTELHVTYDTISNIEVTEEPKFSGEDLLAEIGNHLHLFLGMSLLSFVEVFEFVLSLVFTHKLHSKIKDDRMHVPPKE